jgi:hypothetical protein
VHESLPNKYPGPELHQPDLACSAACTLKTVRCLFTLGTSPPKSPRGYEPRFGPHQSGVLPQATEISHRRPPLPAACYLPSWRWA